MKKQNKSKIILKSKREQEKHIVGLMIRLYCQGNQHQDKGLCDECAELLNYASKRVDFCPFMETKTFCQNCEKHCYNKEMKEKIRKVMRYSGPKMLFHHPLLAIKHLIESHKEKRKGKKIQE